MLLEHPVTDPPLPAAGPVHRLAEGTELLGEYQGSGLQEPRFLIRRSDGQVMQVPLLLYRVASALDGQRGDEALAAGLAVDLDRELTAEQFSFLVEEKLRPAGVVAADGDPNAPEAIAPVKSDPLLALRYRVGAVDERWAWHLAGPLRFLFRRPAWLAVLAGLIVLDVAILAGGDLLDHLLAGVQQVIRHPELVLLVILLQVVALAFHEIGHVTACRFGGARPGGMGIGLYLIWPAFYSTVTDAYRLDRVGRLRTDLGGVYFNAIFLIGADVAYLHTREPWLLLALIVLHTETLWQFLPSIRLDGYYILGDLAGVPDLFSYVVPAIKSLLPNRPTDARLRELRGWPRRVIVGWVAVTVPMLLFYLVAFLLVLPHVLPVVFRELGRYVDTLEHAARTGLVVQTSLGVFQGLMLLLPWVGMVMITVTIGGMLRRAAVARWGRGRVRPGTWVRVRAYAALAGVGGLAAALVFRVWQVRMALPATGTESRLTGSALAALSPGSLPTHLEAGDLPLRQQLVGYAELTGAFRRHVDVLDGSRELAVLATMVLVACLLVFAARLRVRRMAVVLPLVALLLMGPVISILAGLTGALVAAAWTAVGLLVLLRRRPRHLRGHGLAGRGAGGLAVAIGVVTCPLLLLPVASAAAVVLGRRCRRSRRWLVVGGALACAVTGVAAVAAGVGWAGGPLVDGSDRAVVLLAAALVVVGPIVAGGPALARLAPWMAAAAAAWVGAALPWSGSSAMLPLVIATVAPLGLLLVQALVGVPVEDRPHPLVRAALVAPVLVLTVVGGLFMPPSAPALPHAALASWLTDPVVPTSPVVVPAAVWADLVRDGVPAERLRQAGAEAVSSDEWVVVSGEVPDDEQARVVARFGSGGGTLAVLAPTPVAAQ